MENIITAAITTVLCIAVYVIVIVQERIIQRLRAENKRHKLHIAMLYDELTAAQRAQQQEEETFIVWREMWTDEEKARGN